MTKRKNAPVIVTETETQVIRDFGVYREVGNKGGIESLQRRVEQSRAAPPTEPPSAVQTLADMRLELREKIRQHIDITPPDALDFPEGCDWFTAEVDIGEGRKNHMLAAPRTAGVNQACQLLNLIDVSLGLNPDETTCRIFLDGMLAGRLRECMNVLPSEPDALRGKKKTKRNQDNNAKRSAEAEVRRNLRQKRVEAEMERQRQKGQRLNYGAAVEEAAKQEGCSVEIVKLNVPNIWTSRRTRNR